MKHLLLFIFIIAALGSTAQNKYRFSVGGGFHSMMFWGLRDFEDVVCPTNNEVYRIYEQEIYNINYGNFLTSKNYSMSFSVNWMNQDQWMLKQSFSFFKGTLRDEVRLTLTDHGLDTTVYYPGNTYTSSNVTAGNVTDMSSTYSLQGYSTSLIALRKTRCDNLKLGFGLFFVRYFSYDGWNQNPNYELGLTGYRPISIIRATGNYFSNQLGLSLNLNCSWKFFDFYLNIGNSIVTTEREEKKGYIEWQWNLEPFNFFPSSHNFDYRFPLTFETGIALSFDKIKK